MKIELTKKEIEEIIIGLMRRIATLKECNYYWAYANKIETLKQKLMEKLI